MYVAKFCKVTITYVHVYNVQGPEQIEFYCSGPEWC